MIIKRREDYEEDYEESEFPTTIIVLIMIVVLSAALYFGLSKASRETASERMLCEEKGGEYIYTKGRNFCIKKEAYIDIKRN